MTGRAKCKMYVNIRRSEFYVDPQFFFTIYLDSIGKLLAFGWPNKRRINFILEHSAMRKSELYSQEQCISDVYIYPQMSSPMLSPLSA